ncbi:MAG: YqiA/YcfP family alpha/beta fold hydrolase [Cyanobacteriota bacterium]|nr:YqiA/YcfP family alpha/beta fold hydrolase [Cyanobacteriota bacterium]
MFPQYWYLHGFASSPQSAKAQFFQHSFAERGQGLRVPDLNQGDFRHLTLTRQLEQVGSQLPNDPVVMIGSSLGGLVAAHLAERYPQIQRLLLLAPAFQFLTHWLPKLGDEALQKWQEQGSTAVYHYGEKQKLLLDYEFIRDAQRYQDSHLTRPLPTLIWHGRQDEVIPVQASRAYAAHRPWVDLIELDSDHALTDHLAICWPSVQQFCLDPYL